MLPTKFRFIWPSGFRGGDFFKLANQKQELPVVVMFGNGSKQNVHSLERTFHRCFLLNFSSFGWWVSEEKTKMWKVTDTDNKRRMPSDAKSPHCHWQSKLKRILKCEYLHVMYSINMLHYISISKFLREIMASYLSFNSLKARVISLNSLLQWRRFWKCTNQNKNWLWWPCLLTDRDEMSNLYRGPSIDASYQVSVHLAKRF
jgi:hypothetical protein